LPQSSSAVHSFHKPTYLFIATTQAHAPLQFHIFLSTATRKQTANAPNTILSRATLGRKLAATGTTHIELETLLRERNTWIERLEAHRRRPAERGQNEGEEKVPLSEDREEEKGEWQKLSPPPPIHI